MEYRYRETHSDQHCKLQLTKITNEISNNRRYYTYVSLKYSFDSSNQIKFNAKGPVDH